MAYEKGGNCWNCGADLSPNDYGRGDSCPKCGRDTKTCRGCSFYDASVHNECHETQAERVVDKERANFCDYFRPRSGKDGAEGKPVDAAKAAAEALFKK